MNHDVDWNALLSAIAGGGAVAALAKALIARSLSELEETTRKVEDVLIRLSAITVKIEAIDKIQTAVEGHDRKLAVLDARSRLNAEHGAARRTPGNRP